VHESSVEAEIWLDNVGESDSSMAQLNVWPDHLPTNLPLEKNVQCRWYSVTRLSCEERANSRLLRMVDSGLFSA
jgi:hypothetical protein